MRWIPETVRGDPLHLAESASMISPVSVTKFSQVPLVGEIV